MSAPVSEITKTRARNYRRFKRKLAVARSKILNSTTLGFNDPPALAIDRFIDVLLGGDGSNTFPLDDRSGA